MSREPVKEASVSSKRRWVILGVGLVTCGGLLYGYFSEFRIKYTLSDGREVYCDGVVKGRKVTDSDFEQDVYVYRYDQLRHEVNGFAGFFKRLSFSSGRSGIKGNHYIAAPEVILGGVMSSGVVRSFLHDGLGNRQTFLWTASSHNLSGSINSHQLPMGSAQWRFDFRDDENQSIGSFAVPNPSYKSKPGFAGNHPPLLSKTSKGVMRLLTANASAEAERRVSAVDLAFDVSGCPDLLPCQVIGVRVTDSWGNTRLIQGALEPDGKTIRARWRDNGDGGMQSSDWKIRIAICRGMGAKFAAGEIARFENIPVSGRIPAPTMRTIHGRDLTLEATLDSSDQWESAHFYWEVDQKGAVLWPILAKVVGRMPDGRELEIVPGDSKSEEEYRGYHLRRNRFQGSSFASAVWLAKTPRYNASVAIPQELKEYDLHMALEEPTVFEFFAKVSHWPTPQKATGHSAQAD